MPGREHFQQLEPFNGGMANNMEEMILLGKQMEKLRTGDELKENHRHSDPIQFEKNY
ncbi:hypothetical protein [Jeotgalibacillus soli]|uniref:Multidrug ABC transporter ATPase n=1 Tax=Jeotgalibacillus soli TaxID=889306 RepID=A0A0C2VCR9_9BACL|nr:hypothetical protein [Jeotgalibacillus soli]KIL46752.1 hypothetical protein KP78_18700 [Jeotgalibacillus soli]